MPSAAPPAKSTTHKLTCKSPVPADIDIAQSVEPLPITDIAAAVGLTPEDYEQYGPVKAKVGARWLGYTIERACEAKELV
jgi:formate--tetrahydrofolate ligase